MLTKVVFVALLACAVAFAADVEGEAAAAATTEVAVDTQAVTETAAAAETAAVAETEAAADVAADAEAKPKEAVKAETAEKKIIRPHMHARGGLFKGHVKPFPVGYDAKRWNPNVRYYRGGRARTTEELLRPYRGVDRRVEIDVKGEALGPYPWETPEYEGAYNARTGISVRHPLPRRYSKRLPVVHYRRGHHSIRPRRARRGSRALKHVGKPRRANTPKPARRPYIPGRPKVPKRAKKAKGSKKAKKAKKAKQPKAAKAKAASPAVAAAPAPAGLEAKVDRLEKTVTFALRELGRHLGRIRKLEKFAAKGKKAIALIATTLQNDEKRAEVSAGHIELLRKAALQTEQNLSNLHQRSKAMNALVKKHKKAIKLVAGQLQKTQTAQNLNIDNINALRKSAHGTAASITALGKSSAAAILANHERLKKDELQQKANAVNTAALHKAATAAQRAILDLDQRLRTTTKLANKEKKALGMVFKVLANKPAVAAPKKAAKKAAAKKPAAKKAAAKKAAAKKPKAKKTAAAPKKAAAKKPAAKKPKAKNAKAKKAKAKAAAPKKF